MLSASLFPLFLFILFYFLFIFFLKGLIIYLVALKKGAIRHTHPYYAIYRKLTPLPAPRVWGQTKYIAKM